MALTCQMREAVHLIKPTQYLAMGDTENRQPPEERTAVRTVRSSEAMEPADEEAPMIDFREQFIERLKPNQDGFDTMAPSGQAKVYRSAGCWVYKVNTDQEKEFRQWVTDHLGLPELGRVKVLGDFPMLQVVSPLDSPFD
jgi:homogentisate 1,2-dioxygenase